MRRIVVALAAGLAMAGATVAHGAGFKPVSRPPLVEFRSPEAGVETEAEIGRVMVEAGLAARTPAIEIRSEIVGAGSPQNVTLPPGVYLLAGSNKDGLFYQAPRDILLRGLGLTEPWPEGGVFIPIDPASPARGYYLNAFGMVLWAKVPAFTREHLDVDDLADRGFRREIIYTGVSKGVLTLQYREYARELARPAFTQTLTYDLAEGDEVGYSGARIRIVKAGNSSVRFVVLAPLAATQPRR